MATTIQSLAADYSSRFEKRTRDNGAEFWCVKDNHKTDELQELCHAALADMLPDDFRYEFIVEALDAIAATSEDDREAEDATVEADIYTHELTSWLNSRADRLEYCDDAIDEWGSDFKGTFQLLQLGQYAEKREVLDSVRQSLLNILESQEEE